VKKCCCAFFISNLVLRAGLLYNSWNSFQNEIKRKSYDSYPILLQAVCDRIVVEPNKAIRKFHRVQHLYARLAGELRSEDDEVQLTQFYLSLSWTSKYIWLMLGFRTWFFHEYEVCFLETILKIFMVPDWLPVFLILIIWIYHKSIFYLFSSLKSCLLFTLLQQFVDFQQKRLDF
jgi:hypothetical protein